MISACERKKVFLLLQFSPAFVYSSKTKITFNLSFWKLKALWVVCEIYEWNYSNQEKLVKNSDDYKSLLFISTLLP